MTYEEQMDNKTAIVLLSIMCEQVVAKLSTAKVKDEQELLIKNHNALEYAIKAVKKQIKEKPNDIKILGNDVLKIGLCRECGNGVNSEMSYCSKCGHSIDWSEKNI